MVRVVLFIAELGPAVDVDFRTGTARTRGAHFPEVVFVPEAENTLRRQIGDLGPELSGLVVFLEHRGPQCVLRQTPLLGQQLPGPLDGLALVVVAERPVSEHFEKGVVVGVATHLFQVVVLARNADALLDVRRPLVRPLADAQEHILELVHAGIGEEKRGVVLRHHRCARNDGVAVPAEKLKKGGTNLRCCHRFRFRFAHGRSSSLVWVSSDRRLSH